MVATGSPAYEQLKDKEYREHALAMAKIEADKQVRLAEDRQGFWRNVLLGLALTIIALSIVWGGVWKALADSEQRKTIADVATVCVQNNGLWVDQDCLYGRGD